MRIDRLITIATLALVISGSRDVFAQSQFLKVYGGDSYDVGKALVQTSDNGYVIAGSTGSFDLGNAQFMLIRIDAWGSEQWRKYYGGPFSDQLESMAVVPAGGYIMAGVTETLDMSYQVAVIRVNENGDVLWEKNYGGAQWDIAKKVIALSDGGFAIAGQTFSNGGQGQAILMCLDASGDTLWTRNYGGPATEGANALASTADDGFIMAATTESYGAGAKDVWLMRLNSTGDTIWTKTYGGDMDDVPYAVLQTIDGGYAIAGGKSSGSVGMADFHLFKVDAAGQEVWSNFFGGPNTDQWHDLLQSNVGDLVTIGYSKSDIGAGVEDFFISRVGADGIFGGLTSTYGSGGNERAYGIIQTSDNGYAMVGETDGYLNRMTDVLFLKTDYSGVYNSLLTSIEDAQSIVETSVVACYPNPFSTTTLLVLPDLNLWRTSFDANAYLEVYDQTGRVVYGKSIIAEQTLLDMSTLSQGVYLYAVHVGGTIVANGRLVRVAD